MDTYTILTLVVCFTALAAWINDRFLRLPVAIGVMLAGLAVACGLTLCNLLGWADDSNVISLVKSLHLDKLLIGGQGRGTAGQGILLGVLLFASALRFEPIGVTRRIGVITWLATVGVVLMALSTAVGLALAMLIGGSRFAFSHLLLFGAIMSPTDAVAALSLLRPASAPNQVRQVILGESLFNDGSSIVLFLFIIAFISGNADLPFGDNWMLAFLVESCGAVILGIVMGFVGRSFMSSVAQAWHLVLTTLSIVMLLGLLTPVLFVSYPVASVVAGLVLGRSPVLRRRQGGGGLLVGFWGLIENALTAMLFLLIGLELLVVDLSWLPVLWGIAIVPLLLLARFIALVIPWVVAKLIGRTTMAIEEVALMTWCGLRGGVSIAMAIAIPSTILTARGSTFRTDVMVVTIVVVIASILIQGLTVDRVVRMLLRRRDRRTAAALQRKPG